jgi:hypothetical protein
MGRISWLFHPASEALSLPLATMSPLMMGRLIKRGPIRRKEAPTTGLEEWT